MHEFIFNVNIPCKLAIYIILEPYYQMIMLIVYKDNGKIEPKRSILLNNENLSPTSPNYLHNFPMDS